MITLQRFIDFLTIYSLYFYKNSRRARGCSFYFNFTIKDISTCSPELLLLCFCGLHSIYFLKKKNLHFPHSICCLVVWILLIFTVCVLDSLWVGYSFDAHPSLTQMFWVIWYPGFLVHLSFHCSYVLWISLTTLETYFVFFLVPSIGFKL